MFLNADLPNATLFAHKRDTDDRLREIKIPEYAKGETPLFDLMVETARLCNQEERLFDTVVADPIGNLYQMLLDEASSRAVRVSMNIRLDMTTQLERWCRGMCKAPVNFVMVCHELMVDQEDGEGVETIRKPNTGSKNGSLTGLGPKLESMVDIIGYTQVIPPTDEDGKRYVAQLVSAKGRDGGDRFDVLGLYADLNLTEWFTKAGVWLGEPKKEKK